MATIDLTDKVTVKRMGPDFEGGLGVMHLSATDLPEPVLNDVWRIAKIPDGCVPFAWGMRITVSMGSFTLLLKFTNSDTFFSASIGGAGSIPILGYNTESSVKSGGNQESQDYLEMTFNPFSSGSSGGAFELFILYYKG